MSIESHIHNTNQPIELAKQSSSVFAGFFGVKRSAWFAFLAVMVPMMPLLVVMVAAINMDADTWARVVRLDSWSEFTQSRLWRLIVNTLWLAFLTAIICVVLALPAAWLVARFDFLGRKWLSRLLVLPVAIPPYLLGIIYLNLNNSDHLIYGMEIGSIVQTIFNAIDALFGFFAPEKIRASYGVEGVSGAAVILALAGFPYLFLMLKQRFQNENAQWQDCAKVMGVGRFRHFLSISLPWLRPAIIAGLTIVTLHVLADYGTVESLGVETFTQTVFLEIESGRMELASGLSVVLLGVGLLILFLGWLGQTQRSAKDTQREFPRKRLNSQQQILALISLFLLLIPMVVIPVVWLVFWAVQNVLGTENLQALALDLLGPVSMSALFSVIAMSLAMLFGFALAYYRWRHDTLNGRALQTLGSIGFVLPGPIVALGLLTFVAWVVPTAWLGLIINSYGLLAIALAVRYLPIAIQGQQSALAGVNPRMLEAAQLHGFWRFTAIVKVLLPAIRSGLFATAVLVAIEILKDLPIALLLKPIGVETLPMALWNEKSQESEEAAALSALVLVLLSLPLIALLDRNKPATPRTERS